MSRHKVEKKLYRNIRLSVDTYEELNNYLLKLMQSRGDTQLSFDEAVKTLLKQQN